MTVILKWMLSNWKLVAGGVVVLLVLTYIKALQLQISSQTKQLVDLASEVATCKQNVDTLSRGIDVQNEAIAATDSQFQRSEAEFKQLEKTISRQVKQIEQFKRVLAEPKPATCEETIKYLIEARKEYR